LPLWVGYLVILQNECFWKMNTRHQAHKPVNECNYWSVCEFSWKGYKQNIMSPTHPLSQKYPMWTWLQPLQSARVDVVKLRHGAKFRGDRSSHCRDVAIFRSLQDGGRPLSWIRYVCVRPLGWLEFNVPFQSQYGYIREEFGDSRRAFGGLYYCAKFGWNRHSSFDNMHVFDFVSLARRRLFTPPKLGFRRIWPSKWGVISRKPKQAYPCASPRRLSHHAPKSVDGSDPRKGA